MKITAADRAWSLQVRDRDGWACRKCLSVPAPGGLHAHHIFTRGRGATRTDIANGVSLCYGHHRWAHANPLEFHEWIKADIGAEVYDALRLRSTKTKASAS